MSTIVYRISVLLSAIVAEVPVGTNLGLFWLLWALISGRFLLSRGAVFPALADGGLSADAVRRSGAALAYGCWAIQTLVRAWHQVVQQEGRWHAQSYEGFRLGRPATGGRATLGGAGAAQLAGPAQRPTRLSRPGASPSLWGAGAALAPPPQRPDDCRLAPRCHRPVGGSWADDPGSGLGPPGALHGQAWCR